MDEAASVRRFSATAAIASVTILVLVFVLFYAIVDSKDETLRNREEVQRNRAMFLEICGRARHDGGGD